MLQAGGHGRPALECRGCESICERVISPWQCLKSECVYVYAYEEGDTTYFGCLHKVFSAELDLDAFSDEPSGLGGGHDPYGPIRMVRSPRAQCRVTIEQGYDGVSTDRRCCNPWFLANRVQRDR
jgi:hypothetical protein